MSFGGPPVKTETSEEEDELVRHDENESKIGRFYSENKFPCSALLILQRESCLDWLMEISHLLTCK